MPSGGFEPAIPEIKRLKTQPLNSAAEGIGLNKFSPVCINLFYPKIITYLKNYHTAKCSVTPCDVTKCSVTPYDVTKCSVNPCDVTECSVTPCDVTKSSRLNFIACFRKMAAAMRLPHLSL